TPEQWRAKPIPGTWSTLEVVCHIADFEPVYADRMKRILAEHLPVVFGGNPDQFAANLAYDARDPAEELELIDVVRQQMARILRTLGPSDFDRVAIHSVAGPMSIEALLHRITGHIPHHVKFIEEKRRAMGTR
ncbi:MAG: DinB family protein, partial [Planctomycetaceae bacterium]